LVIKVNHWLTLQSIPGIKLFKLDKMLLMLPSIKLLDSADPQLRFLGLLDEGNMAWAGSVTERKHVLNAYTYTIRRRINTEPLVASHKMPTITEMLQNLNHAFPQSPQAFVEWKCGFQLMADFLSL